MSYWLRPVLIGSVIVLSNFVVYGGSTPVDQFSGNGFNPLQFVALMLSGVLGIFFVFSLIPLGRFVAAKGMPINKWVSLMSVLGGGVGLLFWSWIEFQSFEQTLPYYQEWGADHGFGLINHYTVGFWAISWKFWVGITALPFGLGLLIGPLPPDRIGEQ